MNKLNQLPELLDRAKNQWQEQRPELPVEDATLIGCLIGVAANLDDVGMSILNEYGLGQREHDVLACLRRQGEPFIATPNLLLEEVRITSGALTACLNRLIEKQLIIRETVNTDGRSKPIKLTKKGKLKIDQVTSRRFDLAQNLLKDFAEKEKTTIKKTLLRLNQSLQILKESQE